MFIILITHQNRLWGN